MCCLWNIFQVAEETFPVILCAEVNWLLYIGLYKPPKLFTYQKLEHSKYLYKTEIFFYPSTPNTDRIMGTLATPATDKESTVMTSQDRQHYNTPLTSPNLSCPSPPTKKVKMEMAMLNMWEYFKVRLNLIA